MQSILAEIHNSGNKRLFIILKDEKSVFSIVANIC